LLAFRANIHTHKGGSSPSFFFLRKQGPTREYLVETAFACLFFVFTPRVRTCHQPARLVTRNIQFAARRIRPHAPACAHTHTHARTHAHGWAKKIHGPKLRGLAQESFEECDPFCECRQVWWTKGVQNAASSPSNRAPQRCDAKAWHAAACCSRRGIRPDFSWNPSCKRWTGLCAARACRCRAPLAARTLCRHLGLCDKESQGTHVSWLISRAYAGDTGHARICASV